MAPIQGRAMRQHRPEGFRGAGDVHLLPLSRELQKVLLDTQRLFSDGSLRLRKTQIAKLANILVGLAEDLHNEIGIWDAYEHYNLEFFGVRVPFSPTKRRGQDLTKEQEEAIQQFIDSDAISPAFVRRVVSEYGSDSVKAAFRLPANSPGYWLDYLLRSRKGHFYRRRYPTVSVI